MDSMSTYYVYIVTNKYHTVFYTGNTHNLVKRLTEHNGKAESKSFASRYNCTKLVYYEIAETLEVALLREKQIKRYKREWKINLITKMNPKWVDLSMIL